MSGFIDLIILLVLTGRCGQIWVDKSLVIKQYSNLQVETNLNLLLCMVHGAGHVVPTYKPEQAYVLFESWLGLN
jgi:hypothetical protein